MSDTDEHADGALKDEAREVAAARAEQDSLRRDREKATRAAEREADRARKDVERAERDRAKLERQSEKAALNVQKEAERRRAELVRSLREAEREAGQAQRDAEKAALEAGLARQRAERAVDKALRRAAVVKPDAAPSGAPTWPGVRVPNEIAILWRSVEPAQRGPRPGLSLDRIAAAGIALADADGIGAVSMARVAESLGFTTMSLYRYVTSKDDVLALMTDAAFGSPPDHPEQAGAPWRVAAEQWIADHGPILLAHPWLASTSATLTTLGPNHLAWAEAIVAALSGTELTPGEKLQVGALLGTHLLTVVRIADGIAAFGRATSDEPAAERTAGTDYLTMMAALVDPATHPALHAAVRSQPQSPEPASGAPVQLVFDQWPLDFGARLILDGIGALVADRTGTPPA